MNAAFGQPTIGLSANERFKLGYPRKLRGAAVAVVAILALIIRITPEYRPEPYVLRSSELTLIELEEPPVLTEPAPIAPPLPLPPVVEPGDDDSALDTIEIPPFDLIEEPYAPIGFPTGDEGFVPSSTKPALVHFAKPVYPEIARLARLEGTVVVHVLVGVDGRVLDAVVVQGAHPQLDRAALAAARLCRFTPGRQRELPVKAWMAVPYRFRMN